MRSARRRAQIERKRDEKQLSISCAALKGQVIMPGIRDPAGTGRNQREERDGLLLKV